MLYIRVIQDEYNEDLIFKLNHFVSNEDFYLKQNDIIKDMISLFFSNSSVFFRYTEYDKDLDPDKEEMRNYEFKVFYDSQCPDRSGYLSNPVREFLYNYYKSNNEKDIENIEAIKESLLINFRQTPLDNMDENVKNSIADILYDRSMLCKLTDYSKETQDFVNQKLVITSNEWNFPYNERLNSEEDLSFIRDLWVKLDGEEDIINWLKYFSSGFSCIITKDDNIYDYSYYLMYTYEEWDTDEEIVIHVFEKERGSFLKNVYPMLKLKFKDRISKINKL
ncbi:hypothetical protein HBE96_10185 [Clostridium sp. P21]|uniref:Uncharacterized protein n=1 Tax=Clostridium muellerianum TaxID=2716538 RepID=A0A7Y0HNW0_9CLOT|nr:hypothetical protein [Clostridium muellerianum]NMM63062.1 hypothetical protein [Clostridium muellerianum]